MCGIFAYSGHQENAGEIVIKGLKKLEYRGYDSWGIAFNKNSKLDSIKQVGKIGEYDVKSANIPTSEIAIGHSRWATHGGVTVENAHPHLDENNDFAVVHNGIIENHEELRDELQKKGYKFKSSTDTETIVHLLADFSKSNDFLTAAKLTLKKLKGRYAVLLIKGGEHKIIAARRGSPLIVGVGENEYFIASDIPAFLE
ncbi:glutamine--fructose-6-phosphate aminotransferase, partial [Candidatus Peregrinibacteria bacterium]|nr:glutamine--fructose-6-phosphate aminotransferase [Candidatus Peregrinibacteria bacterium]